MKRLKELLAVMTDIATIASFILTIVLLIFN